MINLLDAAGLALFTVLLVSASLSDVRHLRIPNWISLALIAVLVVVRLGSGQAADLPWALLAGLAALMAGVVLYALKVWGAGDAKLLAGVAAWVGFEGLARLLLVTTVAGGVLAIAMILLRRLRPASPMPYGVAIAIGGIDWALSRIL